MTDVMTNPPDDDDAALAGEFALGLLRGEERASAEIRIRRDDTFALLVRAWQEDLAPLALAEPEVVPSNRARTRLMRRLFKDEKPKRSGFMGWLEIATLTFGALAIAAFFYFGSLPTPEPSFVAELVPEQREFVLTAAVVVGDDAQIQLTRGGEFGAPEGRVTELWAILPDQAPVSLGVLPDDTQWTIDLPAPLADQAGALILALSDEPLGGSPTGAPTGDVLAAVPVSEL